MSAQIIRLETRQVFPFVILLDARAVERLMAIAAATGARPIQVGSDLLTEILLDDERSHRRA